MIDVTGKRVSLRRATAQATVHLAAETAVAVREGRIPKGSVADVTRAAALLAIKRTPDILPFCHRIPIEHAEVSVWVEDGAVHVRVDVAAIARTGVEVEAMTGAAVAALNVYDMVKPIDPAARIGEIRLLAKSGGASQHRGHCDRRTTAGVLVVSDGVASGGREDSAGAAVAELLSSYGVEVTHRAVVADEPEDIATVVRQWCDASGLDLVFAVGGTGLGPRDATPEAIRPLLDREIPGLGEAVRSHGRERTPLADLSRACGGHRGRSVVIAVAGSARAARESAQALMPWLCHVLEVFDAGYRHEG
jgi:cyclic pyranopterin phosphate synthase